MPFQTDFPANCTVRSNFPIRVLDNDIFSKLLVALANIREYISKEYDTTFCIYSNQISKSDMSKPIANKVFLEKDFT